MTSRVFPAALVCLALVLPASVQASDAWKVEHKNAIVLAMFGTTVESALQGLLNIRRQVAERYPETPVRVAFTSNIIRKKWQRRAQDPDYARNHPEIPEDILHVKTLLATIADLQNQGHDTIVIQPTHVAMGEEFLDLGTYVDGLLRMGTIKKAKYKPFHKIALGRPALGTHGPRHPYFEDIRAAARALKPDADLARSRSAALVYMAHGNEYFPSGGAYMEFAQRMREAHPGVPVFIGSVEGYPGLDEVVAALKREKVERVVLKPFMVVAGDHAMNDMAGDEPDSWKSVLEREGFQVETVRQGLGENDAFAALFVQHLADAAADAGISLR